MPAQKVACYVLGSDVTVVDDINGDVQNVVCPEFNRVTCKCEKKREQRGSLKNGVLGALDRLSGARNVYCEFIDPEKGIAATISKLFEK